MQTLQLPKLFERYRAEIDAAMRSAFDGRKLPLYDMLQYHLGWLDEHGKALPNSGGKALRPTLCLLASDAVASKHNQAIAAAAAIELVHNFSLIHDDIQDNDRERRHRPTVWRVWGAPQGINAGSAMLVLASLALVQLGDESVTAAKQLQVSKRLDESCLEMIEGQYLDISFEKRFDISVPEYLDMIDKKTGALISCSLEIGARLGADDENAAIQLGRFGRKLGAAFQIRDDILGIWGDAKLTGKPLGADIRRKKKSLPVVYGLEKADERTKKRLQAIYRKESVGDRDAADVLGILSGLGAQNYAQKLADQFRQLAMQEIDGLPLQPQAKLDFEELATFTVEREF